VNREDVFARAEAAGRDGAFSRIDESHPVDIFLGLESGQRAIMVVCPTPPPEPPSLSALAIETRPRQSGGWALVVRLERPDLKALFSRLVEDLDEATRQRPEDPGGVVMGRLARWQRMFSRRPSSILEDHELRGFVAELDFLISEAIPAVGTSAGVAAWVGPFDAPKDFVFSDVEVEVKALRRQARSVIISSLEQLTDAGMPVYLWCRVLDLDGSDSEPERSVAALVRRARSLVADDAGAAERLEEAFQAVGYRDDPEYERHTVVLGQSLCHAVRSDFPRIQRPEVASGVIACRYEIATSGLADFVVDSWREGVALGS